MYKKVGKHGITVLQHVFSTNNNGYQTIWIEDQAKRFMGPDLDPYGLQCHIKLTFSRKCKKYGHFVPEILEGTVYAINRIEFYCTQSISGLFRGRIQASR